MTRTDRPAGFPPPGPYAFSAADPRGPSSSGPAAGAPFLVTGDVARPVTLTVAGLRSRWRQHEARVVFECGTKGPQRHTFSGPLLREVLAAAGPTFDPARRKDRSRYVVAVQGRDGHGTVLSWAEIDEDFGNVPMLLATSLDGMELDAAGSQLVVPSDWCGARYVSAISRVWVGDWQGPLSAPGGG